MTHPLQPDHSTDNTVCLLVHGWKCEVCFDDPKDGWDALTEIEKVLEAPGGVYVVAQDMLNGQPSGNMTTVIGVPVAAAYADEGPTLWSLEDARKIEKKTASAFSSSVRDALADCLEEPLEGKPKWFLVPSGALASGYCAYGNVVDSEDSDGNDTEVEEGHELIWGTDMGQERHEESVDGVYVAKAFDWEVEEVDLSAATCSKLTKSFEGKFYLIARYD